ncbi:universal stress protein [Breoghania corrubedonensis]|uniref:universal stress protein n=1 Tax=Breoghania corrubedonensis TaxID=665038 RepID=UPI001AEC8DD9|nr:universal stress protein [Breoghania corrubedonensis]
MTEFSESGSLEFEAAISLAQRFSAHLSILVVGEVPPLPFYGYGAGGAQVWVEESEQRARNLKAAGERIEAMLSTRDISFDVRPRLTSVAGEDEVIARHAIYADLTMMLRPRNGELGTVEKQTIDGALFDSGRPLLVMPDPASSRPIGRHVLVAWNAQREAARALADAMPLIASAETVTLFLVDPKTGVDAHGEEPGADVALLLARHGLRVSVATVEDTGRSVARDILDKAAEVNADLVVMGAYGHSRLRENILGGTTREILETSDIPLFLAH